MFHKKTLRDLEVKDRIVLVRTDYNVPLTPNDDGKTQSVVSDFRIRASLPTLQYLLGHHAAKIILISHLGRPTGKDPLLTLRPVAETLAGLLPGTPVSFVDEATGPEVEQAVEELPEGGILLLENLRFYPGEQANSACRTFRPRWLCGRPSRPRFHLRHHQITPLCSRPAFRARSYHAPVRPRTARASLRRHYWWRKGG